jgi:hypothetical protein
MPAFKTLVRSLRKAEAELARQLDGVRQAISTLEFGGAASPAAPRTGQKRRALSSKARAAISRAQKKRWAKLRRKQ